MAWTSADGTHESHIAMILADGRPASYSDAGELIEWVRKLRNGKHIEVPYQRSSDEVVAWELRCACRGAEDGDLTTEWLGLRFERAATPALENLSDGRVYLPAGHAASKVADREDVSTLAYRDWQSRHINPLMAFDELRTARHDLDAATERFNQAARKARATGRSWEDIGQAAGMTRQAAHVRWGKLAAISVDE